MCYESLRNREMFKDLINKGMEVYEYPFQFLHMKAYLFDGNVSLIGSMNQDRWSWKFNNEVNIQVDN